MDTTKVGAFAGTVGALVSIIPGFLTRRVFRIANLNFLDYSAVLVVGHSVNTIWDWLISAVGHIIFGSVMGVVFAYFIQLTSEEGILLKGTGFGAFLWLFTLSLGSFFKLPHFKLVNPGDCFLILVDAVVYGFTMSYTLQRLTKKSWN
jgi:hypothetical protein